MDTDNLNISCFFGWLGMEEMLTLQSCRWKIKIELLLNWMQFFALLHGILWKSHESCESAARYSHVLSRRDHWHIHAYPMQIQKFKVVSVGPRRSEHLFYEQAEAAWNSRLSVWLKHRNESPIYKYVYIYICGVQMVSGCFRMFQASHVKEANLRLAKKVRDVNWEKKPCKSTRNAKDPNPPSHVTVASPIIDGDSPNRCHGKDAIQAK